MEILDLIQEDKPKTQDLRKQAQDDLDISGFDPKVGMSLGARDAKHEPTLYPTLTF